MNLQRRQNLLKKTWLSEFQEAFYDKERVKAENEYFDLWFEMNREELENKYEIKRLEDWENALDIQDEITLWSSNFTLYCWEICFKNL